MRTVLENIDLCYGCGACFNKCPQKAITMKENKVGFLYPKIDESLCIDCKLCQKVCPAISPDYNNEETPTVYAFAMSEEILYNSSSGGAFTAMAERMFVRGGAVCGVTYAEKFRVHHEIIESGDELDRMRRSKYVQSNTEHTFKETEELLKVGKSVLYTGTPCQIAGLKKYLGKDYDNLITVDLICHGVPSQKYFDEYLSHNYNIEDIDDVLFRMQKSWGVCFNTFMKDGSIITKSQNTSEYMKGFLKDISLRNSCYTCEFCRLPRQGDITIGDLWAAAKMNLAFPYEKGVSIVLVNNEKGREFWKNAVENVTVVAHMQQLPTLKGLNVNIFHSNLHNTCENFLKNYEMMDFEKAVNVTLHKHDVGMMLYMSNNYGSLATNYALYKVVEGMNKSAIVLDNLRPLPSEAAKFAKKYMKLTSSFLERDNWKSVDDICDTFIVGSDMSWDWSFGSGKSSIEYMMLGFTSDEKRRVSYAPSFGREKKVMDESHRLLCKYYLSRFHAISVREDYGVKMCKDLFDLKVRQVLDPVFICEKKYYKELVKDASIDTSEDYLLAYILDPTPGKRKVLLDTAKNLGKKLVVILDLGKNHEDLRKLMDLDEYIVKPNLVDWIAYFMNASHVITDSFHGCCFSVMFKKKFVGIKNRSKQRFDSLANLIGVQSIFYEDVRPLMDNDNFFEELDYEDIHRRLDVKKEECITWLKQALEAEHICTESGHELSMEYAKLLRSRNQSVEKLTKYKEEEFYVSNMDTALKISQSFLEAVCKVNKLKYSVNDMMNITDIRKYFDVIRSSKYYTIILSCKDTCSKYWKEFLVATGLKFTVTPVFRNSFVAIVNNNQILYEAVSNKVMIYHGTSMKSKQPLNILYQEENARYIIENAYCISYIKVLSAGYDESDKTSRSTILVNNIDYSMNKIGINAVLIDNRYGEVVDVFNVNTHQDIHLKMQRK